MTKDQVQKLLDTGHFEPDNGDWFQIAVWVSLGTMFICFFVYFTLVTLLTIQVSKTLFWALSIPTLLLIHFYSYQADRKIRVVNTGLPEIENLKLLRRVFFVLDWPVKETSNLIEITKDHWLFNDFVKAKIVYTDNLIGYVFQYTPTWRGGRPTFYIGVRRHLRHRFKKMLDSFIK